MPALLSRLESSQIGRPSAAVFLRAVNADVTGTYLVPCVSYIMTHLCLWHIILRINTVRVSMALMHLSTFAEPMCLNSRHSPSTHNLILHPVS